MNKVHQPFDKLVYLIRNKSVVLDEDLARL